MFGVKRELAEDVALTYVILGGPVLAYSSCLQMYSVLACVYRQRVQLNRQRVQLYRQRVRLYRQRVQM